MRVLACLRAMCPLCHGREQTNNSRLVLQDWCECTSGHVSTLMCNNTHTYAYTHTHTHTHTNTATEHIERMVEETEAEVSKMQADLAGVKGRMKELKS